MHVCALYGRLELFQYFVNQYNADTMCKNYHGETPFHIAAKENRLDIIKLYHEKYSDRNKFHVEHVANDGFNATLYACMNTNIAIIDYLVN